MIPFSLPSSMMIRSAMPQDQFHLVAHDDHGGTESGIDPPDKRLQFRRIDRVETGRRFVKKENLRVEDHRPGESASLPHAPRQFSRVVVLISREVHHPELHADDAVHRPGRYPAECVERQGNVLPEGHGPEQGVGLEQDADPSPDTVELFVVSGGDIGAADHHPPGRRS